MPPSDPRAEYTRHLESRRAEAERERRLHVRLGNTRLVVALLGAAVAWLAFAHAWIAPWWLLPPAVLFFALVAIHEPVVGRLHRAERAAAWYERARDRLDDRWAGRGETGDRFLDPEHPYAQDLDLFGRGSLFELLSSARTRAGEDTLARWLLQPSPPEEVRARQAAIEELRPRLELREDLAVLGEDVRAGVHADELARWAAQPALLGSPGQRVLALTLAAAGLGSLILWAAAGIHVPFLLAVAGIALFKYRQRHAVAHAVAAVEQPSHDLALLAGVLARLEREPFVSPRLAALHAELETGGLPPSRQIARLGRLIELLDSRDHLLMRILGPLVLWTEQLAFAVEAWRRRSGPAVPRWLAALGEMEALSSLAAHAYEHPADAFPEFAEESPCFDGEGLAHPLLPEATVVRNHVRLSPERRVLVVSGSNMSGKSTLLRTVGVNAVLAMAGAPVRAHRLRLSPVVVGASIRIVDSLRGGSSRFYAEIRRLRRLVDLTAGPLPLLFLLDELLHGTNSHDRRIGAEAIVRALVERGAIGLLTTHDLALAHIADALAPRGNNVHFEDHLENGRIRFDYLLRPGVVRKSNALELMRSVGLEV